MPFNPETIATVTSFAVDAYAQIKYPREEATRFTTLMSDFKNLVAFATKSPNLYKRTRLALAALLNSRSSDVSAEEEMQILPPLSAEGRRRVTNADVANRSSLQNAGVSKKRRVAGSCTNCKRSNRPQVDKHRANSSKCPLVQEAAVADAQGVKR